MIILIVGMQGARGNITSEYAVSKYLSCFLTGDIVCEKFKSADEPIVKSAAAEDKYLYIELEVNMFKQ